MGAMYQFHPSYRSNKKQFKVQYSKNAFEHKLCMANMRTILAGYQFTDKGTP